MTNSGDSSGQQSPIADIAAAFLLLSRIPVFWYRFTEDRPPNFMTSLWAFPLVGLVIGAAGGCAMLLTQALHLPDLFSALIAMTLMVWLSGAMHEDGLADMADGFGGGHDLEAKVRIMHDSRIGTYGVLALILASLGRISLLPFLANQFQGIDLVIIMALIAATARFQPVFQLAFFPISKHASLAKLIAKPGFVQFVIAALICAVPLGWVFGLTTLGVITLPALILSAWIGRLATNHVEGLTGDVMGASTILGEITIMACWVAYLGYLAA